MLGNEDRTTTRPTRTPHKPEFSGKTAPPSSGAGTTGHEKLSAACHAGNNGPPRRERHETSTRYPGLLPGPGGEL